ncbi:MAG: MFS transporter [Clostridiales bacterium]|nr:MFS transporter [Clostridiales bacterium]
MTEKNAKYQKTIAACFVGYIVQAIVNNFIPLLFLTFQSRYQIPLTKITMLVTINFGLQLLVDLAAIAFVDKIGYRAAAILAHLCAAAGLILLTVLPELFADPFVGILLAVLIYAVGGGLLEVLVSPIVEACPSDNKEKAMSLLHSFYCWGHVGVVLLSTVFFAIFGINNWKIMAIIWAIVPAVNTVVFAKVPIAKLNTEEDSGLSLKQLAGKQLFWILMLLMLCAGACEQSVSQWASTFAEKGLGVTKAIGDLAGPMAFALLMGASRAFYGKYGDKINLERFMISSVLLCIASYLLIALVPIPFIGLIGCGICGLSVGILWPGTFSMAAASIRGGGTAMFALLALAGDLGCSGGPTLVGMVSGHFDDNLRMGISAALVFPLLLLIGIFWKRKNLLTPQAPKNPEKQ